jgi:hypothetical protein
MGEIKFTNSLVMAALFAICVITFSINFAVDNDSSISLASDPNFADTRTDINSDLITFNSTVSDAGVSFNEDNVQQGTDTATSGGQFKGPQKASYSTAVSTIKNSFNTIFDYGEFSILINTLMAVLAFIAIRYAYKTWFGKDPD